MAYLERNALLRARNTRANLASKALAWLHRLAAKLKPSTHPHFSGLSDHLLRDIGMTGADVARHRHRWPSEHDPRG